MTVKNAYLIAIVIVAAIIALFLMRADDARMLEPDEGVACTMEAKICPDGSSVGRTGPDCQFAPCPGQTDTNTRFTARFEIYTNGTRRTFAQPMYHRLSEDVYIDLPDPSIVHVSRAGTTWGDFFATLPLTLTPTCLTTGSGDTYCTDDAGKLNFSLNDVEAPDALTQTIKADDVLIISYR